MLSSVSLTILSALLVLLPDPSTAEPDALAGMVLEGRNHRPIASQEIHLPQYMRRDTLLLLTEEPVAQDDFCLRTRWLAPVAKAGVNGGVQSWWLDRTKSLRSEQSIALARGAKGCPGNGYVRLIETGEIAPDQAAWALGHLDTFLNGEPTVTVRCEAEPIFQTECDDIARLRERLGKGSPQWIAAEGNGIRIRFDSRTTLEIGRAEPTQLAIYLHQPAPF
ncbi:MAG: hypothetical protein CL574_11620 [Altererythrobacter sp.]|nr:hypothetical protein [Altererythrobacter sp.]|tara:strand:+ start:342 stop:1004 length:663 start_codon:yes stop_codon:yes gene_type:complete